MMAYELNGVEYPSVTTITGMLDKPALLGWAANCAVDHVFDNLAIVRDPLSNVHEVEAVLEAARKAYAQKKEDAAAAGTMVHDAIEAYIKNEDYLSLLNNEDPAIQEKAINGFQAFLSWEEKNHVEWLESEVQVFCLRHGYAGRFDAIALVNNFRYLIDFKTSKGIYPEMPVQICAYRQAYNEQYQQRAVDNLAILHLDKETAEPTFKPIEKDIPRMTEFFNSLVRAYYFQSNRRLKNNPFVKTAKEWGEWVEMPF